MFVFVSGRLNPAGIGAHPTMITVKADGADIPAVGLGTWELTGRTCVRIVIEALRLGYRHIDTATLYGNEAEVGEALRVSGVPRHEVFLTTKVWQDDLRAGDFRTSVERSLEQLRLSYVDLILIHWPNKRIPLAETIGAMAKVKRDGLARHVGVSNFTLPLLDEAVRLSPEPLVTNQIELHPFLDQPTIVAACRRHGIAVTAYCPIARGQAAGDRLLTRIGQAHEKTAAQVSLRYLVQKGMIVLPRTSKPGRLAENIAIFDFALSPPEMDEIAKLASPRGRLIDGSFAPAWD